jgi:hypothetical protein
MSVPASYDDVTISTTPIGLYNAAKELTSLISDVSSQLETIYNTFNDLQLSWVGSAAGEAQKFSNLLNDSTNSLFGTKKNPSEGVFNRLVDGLQGAAQNYQGVELWATTSFYVFTVALSGGQNPPSSSSPAQPPVGPSVVLL